MIELSNGHRFEYMAASGALGFDGEGYPWERPLRFLGLMDPSLLTVASKTITFEETKGYLNVYNPFTWLCIRPIRGGSVNSIGLTNPGFHWYLNKVAPKADSSKIPLMPSIMSKDTNELIKMAEGLNNFDFVGIEKNDSCANVEGGCSTDTKKIIEDCKAIKEACDLPLILKISVVHDIEFVPKLEGIVEAISINSVPWSIVFPDKKSPLAYLKSGGGAVSGQKAQPYTWGLVKKLVEITSIPVIGPSVWEFGDIEKLRDMGAEAASFGSVHLLRPWRPTKFIRRDMKIKKQT